MEDLTFKIKFHDILLKNDDARIVNEGFTT